MIARYLYRIKIGAGLITIKKSALHHKHYEAAWLKLTTIFAIYLSFYNTEVISICSKTYGQLIGDCSLAVCAKLAKGPGEQ